jgi:hypothetical protein
MGFEAKILDCVENTVGQNVLGENVKAEFYQGTLFVDCNEVQAELIRLAIESNFTTKVRVNNIGVEYAFDFVV